MQSRTRDFIFNTAFNFGVDNLLLTRYDLIGNAHPHPVVCEFLLLSAPTDRFKLLNGFNFLLLCGS